jgi:hypothetical protein
LFLNIIISSISSINITLEKEVEFFPAMEVQDDLILQEEKEEEKKKMTEK